MNVVDLFIIAVYLVGTTLFGCSFFFRKGDGDAAGEFMTGGGKLPTWAIALSIFATHVSSISFLALPAKAYLTNWNPWVLSLTVPIAAIIAAVWFVPFYRCSSDVSAYSFLEARFGTWARLYASGCFLVMQSARSGVILFLLALVVKTVLGFSVVSIIAVTGLATMLYAMMGGISAVVWADVIQSLILVVGAVLCVLIVGRDIPDFGAGFQMAMEAGKFSLGSFSLTDWGHETFWVIFFYALCINLQNFGIDQSFTQRYIAAKDMKSAVKSLFGSAFLYVPATLLFVMIGTLLWVYVQCAPGSVPAETLVKADAIFPWFIVHKLPTGVSGLVVAAIIAAAMSTIAATLNSGATVLLEDYFKRFTAPHATPTNNLRFLRVATAVLAIASVAIALAVMNVQSALTVFWAMQSVLSGGMLGLFLLGAFAKRTRATHALIATFLGFVALAWVTFGQRLLPLPWLFHVNLAIVFGTLSIVVIGFALGQYANPATISRSFEERKEQKQ